MTEVELYHTTQYTNELVAVLQSDCTVEQLECAIISASDESEQLNKCEQNCDLFELALHKHKVLLSRGVCEVRFSFENALRETMMLGKNATELSEQLHESYQFFVKQGTLDEHKKLIEKAQSRIISLLLTEQIEQQMSVGVGDRALKFKDTGAYLYASQNDLIAKGKTPYSISKNCDDLMFEGILYEDSADYIISRSECAAFFLNYLINNIVDYNLNSEIHHTLIKLSSSISSSPPMKQLKPLYDLALQTLQEQLNWEEIEEPDDEDDFDEMVSCRYRDSKIVLNGNKALIAEMLTDEGSCSTGHYLLEKLGIARKAAMLKATHVMTGHLLQWKSINQLNGDCYFHITNISDLALRDGMIQAFQFVNRCLGSEYGIAQFYLNNDGSWILRFVSIEPYENNYIYKQPAYAALVPFLSELLMADVKLVMWLED